MAMKHYILLMGLVFTLGISKTVYAGLPPGAGTQSDPAVLVLDTGFDGNISANGEIYYKFTTGMYAYTHVVDLAQLDTDYSWVLYSDAAYSVSIDSCNTYNLSTSKCSTPGLNANTTYYLKLTEKAGEVDSFTINVKTNFENEGMDGSAINLTIGIAHNAVIKDGSYYSFTSTSGGYYTISLTDTEKDLSWEIYTDPYQYGPLTSCDDNWYGGSESCATTVLESNTTYYFRVLNVDSEGSYFTINIAEGGTPREIGADEGTMTSPVNLNTSQEHTGYISASGTSYYKFSTGSTISTHMIILDRVSGLHNIYVYEDAGYSNLITSCTNGNHFYDFECYTDYLDANKTYYVAINNFIDISDDYIVTVNATSPRDPDSEGTGLSPVTLQVGEVYSGKVGTEDRSYYSFTAPEAKSYRISLTNGTDDLEWNLWRSWDQSIPTDRCRDVTGIGDEICDSTRLDAGETVNLVIVNPYVGSIPATFNVIIETIHDQGEGTFNTPVTLTPGISHNGNALASNLYNSYPSYYQFTTGTEPMVYAVNFNNASTQLEWNISRLGELSTLMSCNALVCEPPLLEPNTTYTVEVTEKDNIYATYDILIESGLPITELTHGVKVSDVTGTGRKKRFYSFTTGTDNNTTYTVTMDNVSHDVSWYMYNEIPYVGNINYNTYCNSFSLATSGESCTVTGLQPNTTYYLVAKTNKDYSEIATYDIVVRTDGGDEGTVIAPVELALGVDHVGKVSDRGHSYYQFTTASRGGGKYHIISLTGLSSNLIWRLYSNPDYTGLVMYCNNYNYSADDEICVTDAKLSTGTTYYLSVEDYDGFSAGYTLNVVIQ